MKYSSIRFKPSVVNSIEEASAIKNSRLFLTNSSDFRLNLYKMSTNSRNFCSVSTRIINIETPQVESKNILIPEYKTVQNRRYSTSDSPDSEKEKEKEMERIRDSYNLIEYFLSILTSKIENKLNEMKEYISGFEIVKWYERNRYRIAEGILSSGLLLILFKLIFITFNSSMPAFYWNIVFFFFSFVYAFNADAYMKIKRGIYFCFIRKFLPYSQDCILRLYDMTDYDEEYDWEGFTEEEKVEHLKGIIKKRKKEVFGEFIWTFFNQIQLFIISEPILYLILRTILFYFLIFNHFYYTTIILSLIGILSKFFFYFSDIDSRDYKYFLEQLTSIAETEEELKRLNLTPEEAIYATYEEEESLNWLNEGKYNIIKNFSVYDENYGILVIKPTWNNARQMINYSIRRFRYSNNYTGMDVSEESLFRFFQLERLRERTLEGIQEDLKIYKGIHLWRVWIPYVLATDYYPRHGLLFKKNSIGKEYKLTIKARKNTLFGIFFLVTIGILFHFYLSEDPDFVEFVPPSIPFKKNILNPLNVKRNSFITSRWVEERSEKIIPIKQSSKKIEFSDLYSSKKKLFSGSNPEPRTFRNDDPLISSALGLPYDNRHHPYCLVKWDENTYTIHSVYTFDPMKGPIIDYREIVGIRKEEGLLVSIKHNFLYEKNTLEWELAKNIYENKELLNSNLDKAIEMYIQKRGNLTITSRAFELKLREFPSYERFDNWLKTPISAIPLTIDIHIALLLLKDDKTNKTEVLKILLKKISENQLRATNPILKKFFKDFEDNLSDLLQSSHEIDKKYPFLGFSDSLINLLGENYHSYNVKENNISGYNHGGFSLLVDDIKNNSKKEVEIIPYKIQGKDYQEGQKIKFHNSSGNTSIKILDKDDLKRIENQEKSRIKESIKYDDIDP